MLEKIPNILQVFRQTSPAIILALTISTGVILFISEDLAATLGLDEIRAEHRAYLGVLFVTLASVVIVQFLWQMVRFTSTLVKDFRKKRRIKANRVRQLQALTPDEKAYSAPYVLKRENTQYFQLGDGVVGGLEAKVMIYRSSNIGDMIDGIAYNIQPWVREYLQNHKELLEGANPNPEGPP